MAASAGKGEPQPNSPDGAQPRPAPASPLSAAPGPAAQGQADGLYRLSGRVPPQAGGRPIDHHVAGRSEAPAGLGKPGCLPPPRPAAIPPPASSGQEVPLAPLKPRPPLLTGLPVPGRPSSARGGPRPGRLRRRCAGATRPLTRPAAHTNWQRSGTGSRLGHAPDQAATTPSGQETGTCAPEPIQVSGQASVLLGRSVRTRRPFHGRPRTGRASGTFRLDPRRTVGLVRVSAITFDSRRLDPRAAGPAACWTSS